MNIHLIELKIMSKVVIIMGSKADLEWARQIGNVIKSFEIETILRIASAHKVPLKCYNLIKEYEKENVVFITIAGMSNALSGFTDAQTHCPVIACPPYSDKFAGADLYSSIRMPSGVAPLTILNPENAALAAAKILGLSNPDIQKRIFDFQDKKRKELEEADNALLNK
jgi:5-(carboxyamino)imidazole ribonucleotide mutase